MADKTFAERPTAAQRILAHTLIGQMLKGTRTDLLTAENLIRSLGETELRGVLTAMASEAATHWERSFPSYGRATMAFFGLPARPPTSAGEGTAEYTDTKTGNRKFTDQAGHVVAEADGAGYLDQAADEQDRRTTPPDSFADASEVACAVAYLESSKGPFGRPGHIVNGCDRYALRIVLAEAKPNENTDNAEGE